MPAVAAATSGVRPAFARGPRLRCSVGLPTVVASRPRSWSPAPTASLAPRRPGAAPLPPRIAAVPSAPVSTPGIAFAGASDVAVPTPAARSPTAAVGTERATVAACARRAGCPTASIRPIADRWTVGRTMAVTGVAEPGVTSSAAAGVAARATRPAAPAPTAPPDPAGVATAGGPGTSAVERDPPTGAVPEDGVPGAVPDVDGTVGTGTSVGAPAGAEVEAGGGDGATGRPREGKRVAGST